MKDIEIVHQTAAYHLSWHVVNNIEKIKNSSIKNKVIELINKIKSTTTNIQQEHFYQESDIYITQLVDGLSSKQKEKLIELLAADFLKQLKPATITKRAPRASSSSSNTLMIVGGVVVILLIVAFIKRKAIAKMF